jgi:ABC-type amino acid transport substrate-binding protein
MCRCITAILIPFIFVSNVFQGADSFGYKSANGSWKGMVALVISGLADIGIGVFTMTKERSEVVAFTDALGFTR